MMTINQLSLLKTRRFLPLFLTQFLGAFNANLYKSALVILITYNLSAHSHLSLEALITIAACIFILPFFLFSTLAGQLADKFEKSRFIRYIKIAEILLMVLVAWDLYVQSLTLLIVTLFLIGTQAVFFWPVKYAILPNHLRSNELIAGNALLEAGTYFAILAGTLIGGMLAMFHAGVPIVAALVIVVAVAGYIASLSIPPAPIIARNVKISLNLARETTNAIRHTFRKRDLFFSILGISWFWLILAIYFSQFPTYAKNVLSAQPAVVTLFLIVFSIGIISGSLICNRLLRSKIHAMYVPIAAIGMTVFAIDLVISSQQTINNTGGLLSLFQFLAFSSHWRILFDIFFLAVAGGLYIVPLNALLQHESDAAHRSRAIACNNMINAVFMAAGVAVAYFMLMLHLSIPDIFLLVAMINLVVAVYICNLIPEELAKSFLVWLFKLLYRVEIRGLENYEKAGKRVLIVANHTSFLDAALLGAFLPDKLTFAINTLVAQRWWMKLLLKVVNTYPIDPTNPLATKSLIRYLRCNKHVVIFPEGRITVTGALMKIYEGPGLVADKADAKMLPIRIDGAQYTIFSYLRGKVRIRWFPKITLTILEPRTIDLPNTITGHARRELISAQLYDIMTDTIFMGSDTNETLFESLIDAQSIHGKKRIVLEDIERKPITLSRLILGSFILGRYMSASTNRGEYVGMLLPNSVAAIMTFFGLQAFHRVPAMLNYSAGISSILSACRTAKIKSVYTSHKFIEKANLQEVIDELKLNRLNIIYLEDVRSKINFVSKLWSKFTSQFPRLYYRTINKINKANRKEFANLPAVVLFTSGSEGTPKGVVLNHANLQANRFQLMSRVDLGPRDIVFNALPIFHSFGLNTATLLPIISGMRVFMYPSPLHFRIVPELCYDVGASILFGTDTFLSGYAKHAHPYNFYSVRYVFAGAERLRDETRKLWAQKFGIRIFEGYGATEASPVLSINTTMQYKMNTVGRLLPGINYQLAPVEGIHEGGRLLISGPNIMMGYMLSQSPCHIIPPVNGWHDTGDIVTIDEEGYITIKGRAKRFAKIAGEMVSLTAIEEEIYNLWPDAQHAVLCQPDIRKGEQIILATNYKPAEQHPIIEHFKLRKLAEISLPRKIIVLDNLPLLGSGKIDYRGLKLLLEEGN